MIVENNVFGRALRELRQEKGLSQKELGKVFHVCNQTISFWESGSREPNLDNLLSIANYFGISVDDLLNGKI